MKQTFRHFLSLQPRATLYGVFGLMVASIGGSLFETAGIALVFPLIGLINNPAMIENVAALSWAYKTLEFVDHRSFSMAVGAAMVTMFFLKNVYMAVFYYVLAGFVANSRAELAGRLIAMYMRAPFAFHLRRNSSEMVRNIIDLVGGTYGTYMTSIITLTADFLIVLGIIVILMSTNIHVTVAAGVILGGLLIVQQKVFGRLFRQLGTVLVSLREEQHASLLLSLGAIKDAKVSCRESYFADAHSDVERRVASNMRMTEFVNRLPSMMTEMALVVAVIGAVVTLLSLTDDVTGVMATLGLLGAAAFRLVPMFNRILISLNTFSHTGEGVRVLAAELEELIREGCEEVPERDRLPFKDALVLDDVYFTYESRDLPAIHGVTLTVRQGEFVGFVGASGAGKSTMADMLLGLLIPTSGHMTVDGVRLGADNIRAWRANVGYMPQQIYVSNESLRRNVAFGIPNSDIDDNQVWEALRKANLYDFAASLPKGLDTSMGGYGARVSGGQRQRIGIARALYDDPEVLIFDEATSSLDVQTEHEITQAIQSLKGSRTLIVIAHRLATLQACDRLVLMQDGRVAGEGSFASLALENAEFKRMVDLARIDEMKAEAS